MANHHTHTHTHTYVDSRFLYMYYYYYYWYCDSSLVLGIKHAGQLIASIDWMPALQTARKNIFQRTLHRIDFTPTYARTNTDTMAQSLSRGRGSGCPGARVN